VSSDDDEEVHISALMALSDDNKLAVGKSRDDDEEPCSIIKMFYIFRCA
jgi:hypothetical protein